MWFIPTSNIPWQIPQNVSAKTLKLCIFLQNSLFFVFLYFAMRGLYCVVICLPPVAWKRSWFSRYSIILSIPFLWKNLCWCTERIHFVSIVKQFLVAATNSNILLQNQNCFHEQVLACKSWRRVRISTLIDRNYCSRLFFFTKKRPGSR